MPLQHSSSAELMKLTERQRSLEACYVTVYSLFGREPWWLIDRCTRDSLMGFVGDFPVDVLITYQEALGTADPILSTYFILTYSGII